MEDNTNPKDRLGIKKVRLSLVPPSSIIYEASAFEDGADKYGPYNWREKKVRLSIYVDAFKRHVDQFWDGENFAQDSKKHHLAHAKACLGIIIDALETGNLVDDRPKKGVASELIERLKIEKELTKPKDSATIETPSKED
jgi:hypothetical protein